MISENAKIAIIGLGYVGLPLAVALSEHFHVLGYDIDKNKIKNLKQGIDETKELDSIQLEQLINVELTNNLTHLVDAKTYIVTVPTPIDNKNVPDLTPLENASMSLAKILEPDNLVIYESTVYPGATREVCIPILEAGSGLKLNENFYVGYSPERINPGDKTRSLKDIVKVVAGSSTEALQLVSKIYDKVIDAGIFPVESIEIAEAAKVIENTQRDINIALINDLAMLFDKLKIDTSAVLEAARTKWNFLDFRPGLVGGHCIGVDPYYLTYKSHEVGHSPDFILSGRRINESVSAHIVTRLCSELIKKDLVQQSKNVLILGYTFKEDCPDTRNSKVRDLERGLTEFGLKVDSFDPLIDKIEFHEIPKDYYSAIIIAVGHREFKAIGIENIRKHGIKNAIVFDIKSIFDKNESDLRL